MGIHSYFTLKLWIIGSKHFLPLHCSRKCQSALAYSFIQHYSCLWLLTRRPSLPVHPATPFKEGYHNDYEKWLLKKPDVTHYLNIKGVWANNKFGFGGLLIKVLKGKELPSEVKCHCQSPRRPLFFSCQRTFHLSPLTVFIETSESCWGLNPHVRQSSSESWGGCMAWKAEYKDISVTMAQELFARLHWNWTTYIMSFCPWTCGCVRVYLSIFTICVCI